MRLDASLRERLRRLAGPECESLPFEAVERVVERVRRDGPQIVRGARRRRRLVGALALAGAAAAVFAATVWRESIRAVVFGPLRPAPSPVVQPAQCAQRPLPATRFREGVLNLGPAGRMTLIDGGRADVLEASPCRLVVALHAGGLDVHAADLGGGALRVEAGSVVVEVRGTRFRVQWVGAGVRVSVREGRVEVRRGAQKWYLASGEQREVDANERAASRRQADTRHEAAGEDFERLQPLRETSSDAPVPPGSASRHGEEGSPDSLVARAARLLRAGDLDGARAAYRAAGQGRGATAESAWIALARLEHRVGRFDEALRALTERRRRFGRGALGAEADALGWRIALEAGDERGGEFFARRLVREHPAGPHADAARRWLERRQVFIERGADGDS
ncbi:MAG: FecR family protein [Myxococcota bacterium]|nr:FecR family protein [Myxococcota bacterium]MDW8362586.1 FecR domain-containing protein [Myxococcales bacterium]